MKINILHILLILIAVQSTIAVADLHKAHQLKQDHLQFSHDLANESNEESDQVSNFKVSYDCHHCCHCHGVSCHYIDTKNANSFSILDKSMQLENTTRISSRSISLDLRPPIA